MLPKAMTLALLAGGLAFPLHGQVPGVRPPVIDLHMHAPSRLVDAGFVDRILFGSDTLLEGIDAILEADFLTDEQKEGILCSNAARFLELGEEVCAY